MLLVRAGSLGWEESSAYAGKDEDPGRNPSSNVPGSCLGPGTTTCTKQIGELRNPSPNYANESMWTMIEALERGPCKSPVWNNTCDFPAGHESPQLGKVYAKRICLEEVTSGLINDSRAINQAPLI